MTQPLTRRQFHKLAASTAAFTTIPSSVLGVNEKVNVAIIGCGGMGGNDGNQVFNTGLVNVVALCDVGGMRWGAAASGRSDETQGASPVRGAFLVQRARSDTGGT